MHFMHILRIPLTKLRINDYYYSAQNLRLGVRESRAIYRAKLCCVSLTL